jgi:gluconolactonase
MTRLTMLGLMAALIPLSAAGAGAAGAAPPAGEVLKFTLTGSTHFPGPPRDYWVYVPAQYRPERPACLYLGLDGLDDDVPRVFDQLIARKQMPVTIGVFVSAEHRSLEYDSLGDALARFLVEELLPDVQKRAAGAGWALRLSPEPGDRAIGGKGSAAVAAFTVAWERPGDFTRVWSAGGTFIGLRGADRYPTLIRKTEPRPIRVLLTAGAGDGEAPTDFAGDLSLAHRSMHAALTFAGYEVRVPGAAGARQTGAAGFREAMRWLWRGWPAPPAVGRSGNPLLREILIPGREGDWQLVGQGYRFTEGPTVNDEGELFFNDIPAAVTHRVGRDGQVRVQIADSLKANGQAFGPDGRLFAVTGAPGQLVAYDKQWRRTAIADGFQGNDLVVAHNGNVYVTNPPDGKNPTAPSQVWLVRPDGKKQVVDQGLRYANGVTLSPDQTVLYVDDHRSRWVYSHEIQSDGTLRNKRRFCALHVPENADDSSADGLKVDQRGRLYVATRTGLLQVCDQQGRVIAILPTPNRRISNLTFAGPQFDTLVVTSGDRVWKRRLRTRGVNAWAPPVTADSAPPR